MPSLCDTCKALGSCCKGFVLTDENGDEVFFPANDRMAVHSRLLREGAAFRASSQFVCGTRVY
jgi:hypothetical protein